MPLAVRIHAPGGPDALRCEDVEVPPPGPGEAQLRQTAVGVNMLDTYHRSGLYPLPTMPHGIGAEAAGVVEAVGEGVADVKPGDRVAYAAAGPPGAYAARRNVPAAKLVPLPDDIDDKIVAASLLKGMTVEYLVRRTFRVERGMTVLFHAAAGGVGLIACQWLRHLGATTIGTVSTDAKAELARRHGCHHTVVYTRESFRTRVREITGGVGVPVVYDSVGKTTFLDSLDCLARRGMLVGYGNASGKPDPLDPLLLSQKGSLYLTRPTLFDYVAARDDLLASANALFDVLRSGAVKVTISRELPLGDAVEAHRALEARETVGSTVLVP
jgi:NADPH2:quinone reductase